MGNCLPRVARSSETPLRSIKCHSLEDFDKLPPEQRLAIFNTILARDQGPEGGSWHEFVDLDMPCEGDVTIIPEWKSATSLEAMKIFVEKNNWSAITVSNGTPSSFEHAALKNFDFPLKAEHCTPCHGYSCKIYIYTPPPAYTKTGSAPAKMPPLPADSDAVKLVLVNAGSPEQCVFENVDALKAGKDFVPLNLVGGKAIVNKESSEMKIAHYHLLKPGVGKRDVAIRARLDKEGFLTCEDIGYVFDVDKWNFQAGNPLWILKEHDDATNSATRNSGGGRSFTINDNGTIAVKDYPHLVLGAWSPTPT